MIQDFVTRIIELQRYKRAISLITVSSATQKLNIYKILHTQHDINGKPELTLRSKLDI